MSDAPSFDSYPEVDNHFNLPWDSSMDFGQHQQSRSPYPMAHVQISQLNPYSFASHEFPGQLQFEYNVPFSGPLQDAARNELPRIDTNPKALGPPRLSIVSDASSSTNSAGSMMPQTPYNPWVGDGHLRVLAPPGTPISPSIITYPTFSPSKPKGLSPIPSPMSPHSPAAMGSSDEGSLLQAFDDDEEDAPQPMEHVVKWKAIRDQAITVTGTTVYIPQSIYQPYTEADRVRYIEKADLKEPIIFKTTHPDQWGIPLDDALRAKMKNLLDKDDSMFENCGPSVSIRLQWPGYRAWTKQIPTMDFKSPKGPITRAKLAKNIANCVKRFIDEKEKERMEMEADRRWRVGTRYIKMEDLILVSLHHISKGSWQPQLRLRTPLNEIHTRRLQVQTQAPQSIA